MNHDREHDPYVENGFRNPLAMIPGLHPLGAAGPVPMDIAVSFLAPALRGGRAGEMAEFLQLALKAVEANGYGITYCIGPIGELGLLVVPQNAETGAPDLSKADGDYALLAEIGTAETLRETLAVGIQKQVRTVPPLEKSEAPVQCETCRDYGCNQCPPF